MISYQPFETLWTGSIEPRGSILQQTEEENAAAKKIHQLVQSAYHDAYPVLSKGDHY